MMEDDMKRNGSGYIDETPIKTGLFSGGTQAGEIWESTMGKEFLILKNHGGFCTTLALNDNPHEKTIEVVSRTVRYTNPSMVGYSFNNCLSAFIKTVPDEKYMDIMQAVGERLGVIIRVSAADDADEIINDATLEAAAFRMKAEDLELLVDKLKCQLKATEAQRDELLDDLENYHNRLKDMQADADMAAHMICVAEEKAALYEKMHTVLLDRLFARGEAK